MIRIGDCIETMRTMEAASVDSIVTDPPYGLGFMGKAWDHAVPGVPFWLEMLRIAKPGAHLVAFGGTRTFHRMACAIEDAGWELRDTLMWIFGSGFPKSHNGEWGGTALKPAWEPIVLARKPLAGTVEANWREHGTGALNIDGCRVPINGEKPKGSGDRDSYRALEGRTDLLPQYGGNVTPEAGRWPANLIHDGSDEVVAMFPQSAGQLMDASRDAEACKTSNAYGAMKRGNGRDGEASADCRYTDQGGTNFAPLPGQRRGDTGSAARFFYCAKADREDRNHGCDGLPLKQSGMVSNTSGQHITRRDGGAPPPAANNHPTVKPTDLMRWLCRLVTPPGGLILDPFTGSGSTGRGAIAEGFRFVGCELDPHYAAIAEARIRAVQPGLSFGAVA